MLSAIVARRVALAFKPATPAFSEEEMVIGWHLSALATSIAANLHPAALTAA
jgi:hypothetical protein